jgi:hypothetical protein
MAALESSPMAAPDSPDYKKMNMWALLHNVNSRRGTTVEIWDDEEPESPGSSGASEPPGSPLSPKAGIIVTMSPRPQSAKAQVSDATRFVVTPPKGHTSPRVTPRTASISDDATEETSPVKAFIIKDGKQNILLEEVDQIFTEKNSPPRTGPVYPPGTVPADVIITSSVHGEPCILSEMSKYRPKVVEAYVDRLEDYKRRGLIKDYNATLVYLNDDLTLDAIFSADIGTVHIGTIDDPNTYIEVLQQILPSGDKITDAKELIIQLMMHAGIINKLKLIKKYIDRAKSEGQQRVNLPQSFMETVGNKACMSMHGIPHFMFHQESASEVEKKKRPVITDGIRTIYKGEDFQNIPPRIFTEKTGKENIFFWTDVIMDYYDTHKAKKQIHVLLTCSGIYGPSETAEKFLVEEIVTSLQTCSLTVLDTGLKIKSSFVGQSRAEIIEAKAKKKAALAAQTTGDTVTYGEEYEDDPEKISEALENIPELEVVMDKYLSESGVTSAELDSILAEEREKHPTVVEKLSFSPEKAADPLSGTSGLGGTRRKRQTKRKRKTKKTKTRKRTRKSFGKTRK